MKSAAATCLATVSALVAIASLGATSVGAVEPAVHLYRCLPVAAGTGAFLDSRCRTQVAGGNYNRYYYAATPETVESTGTNAFEIETTILGQTILITCTTESGTGTGLNPEPFKSTNGEGETTLTFSGCAVSKLSACLPGKQIVTSKLHQAVEESKAFGPGIKFTPAAGTTFAKVILGEECAIGEEFLLQGSDFGIANEKGELEFTNASSALTVSGKEVKLRGKLEQDDGEGNPVSVG